jgi:hypothetical protein
MRQLWCVTCGQPRTIDTVQPLRGHGPTTCLKCGGRLFTTDKATAAQWTPAWLLTESDRRFLRSLRIGTASAREVVR